MGSLTTASTTSTSSLKTEFRNFFPKLVETLVKDIPEAGKPWFRTVLEYNVPHGKLQRGLLTVQTYLALAQSPPNEKEREEAFLLGWCVELLQACCLVADDIMDNSPLRRGQPTWANVEGVGMAAINDILYLESAVYHLLRVYFSHKPNLHLSLSEQFHRITLNTIYGQNLDMHYAGNNKENKKFEYSTYQKIITYKTSYYTFFLPMRLGMLLAGANGDDADKLWTFCEKFGELFQATDDYVDVFGDPKITGKVGTDIAEGKCTWLLSKAFEAANEVQKKLLQSEYGKSVESSVTKVKNLMETLRMPSVFKTFVSDQTKESLKVTDTIQSKALSDMLTQLCNSLSGFSKA